jgi:hypothetical protein
MDGCDGRRRAGLYVISLELGYSFRPLHLVINERRSKRANILLPARERCIGHFLGVCLLEHDTTSLHTSAETALRE